uniref:G_PROTEIN_RECEP_F1_2 domain-containing protein n=1 Tax=Steinernema glaseri TaxID=37863 RepID=A0A1I7Y273_9BILA
MSLAVFTSLQMVSLEDSVAAFVMFTLSLGGLFVNSLAIIFVWRTKALRNVFGGLCLSHAVADIGILFVFLVFAVPLTLLPPEFVSSRFITVISPRVGQLPPEFVSSRFITVISPRVGQLCILLWNCCVYSHFFIAVNRFVAICFPLRFQAVPQRSVFVFVVEGAVWLFGLLHSLPYSWPDCGFEYDPRSQLWNFEESACGDALMLVDFVEGLSCVSAIVLLDFATFAKIRFGKVTFRPGARLCPLLELRRWLVPSGKRPEETTADHLLRSGLLPRLALHWEAAELLLRLQLELQSLVPLRHDLHRLAAEPRPRRGRPARLQPRVPTPLPEDSEGASSSQRGFPSSAPSYNSITGPKREPLHGDVHATVADRIFETKRCRRFGIASDGFGPLRSEEEVSPSPWIAFREKLLLSVVALE